MSNRGAADGFSLRSVALFAFAPAFFFSVAEGAVVPIIPGKVQDLGGDLAFAAAIAMLLGVGSLVFTLPASFVTAKYGERFAIVTAGGGAAAILIAAAFINYLWVFSLMIFALGMAQSVFSLARQSYVTDAVPLPLRARALSTLGGVTRIGYFIGPVCGAAIVSFAGLWGVFCFASLTAVAAALFGFRIPPQFRGPGNIEKGSDTGWGAVGAVLRNNYRVFATVGIGVVLVASVRATRQVVIPLWVSHVGMDTTAALIIYGVSAAVDMVMFYPAGKLMDIRGRRWVAIPSMGIMAVAFLILPAMHSGVGVLVAACLLGFGNGISSGMIMTLAADFSPGQGRAQFLGVWRMFQDFGQFVGPSILSACTAVYGLVAGVASSGLLGIAAAIILGVWGTERRNGSKTNKSLDTP